MDVTATQLISNVFPKKSSHWNSDIVGLGNFPTSKMPFCIYEGTACRGYQEFLITSVIGKFDLSGNATQTLFLRAFPCFYS